jgi:hypothetical protein
MAALRVANIISLLIFVLKVILPYSVIELLQQQMKVLLFIPLYILIFWQRPDRFLKPVRSDYQRFTEYLIFSRYNFSKMHSSMNSAFSDDDSDGIDFAFVDYETVAQMGSTFTSKGTSQEGMTIKKTQEGIFIMIKKDPKNLAISKKSVRILFISSTLEK